MQPSQRSHPIASAVAKCFKSFTAVEETLDTEGDHPELQTALFDCLGQFRIWSGNIDAHQTGDRSLDRCLRDAPSASKSVLQLLSSLDDLILDVPLVLGLSINSDSSNESSDNKDTRRPFEASIDPHFSNESTDDEDSHGPIETKQIFRDISELIASLHRLSMRTRNPVVTRRYKSTSGLDTSAFEYNDVAHVQEKFTSASRYLCCRLGKANSRRRQWLKARELRAENRTQDLKDDVTLAALSVTDPSTVKSSVFDHNTGNDFLESSTSMSATSYATSADAPHKARLPSMPEEARNKQPFECPYCHEIQCISDRLAWEKHTYRDLRPYLCTFEDCISPSETYESRHAWFYHEVQNHRRSWACDVHCDSTFTSEELIVTHIHEYSPMALTDAQARILARMCMVPINVMAMSKCPMCDLTITGLSKFRKHLGGYLEELALFVLPTINAESDTEDDQMLSSCDEIDEIAERMIPMEDERGVDEDSSEITASARTTETNEESTLVTLPAMKADDWMSDETQEIMAIISKEEKEGDERVENEDNAEIIALTSETEITGNSNTENSGHDYYSIRYSWRCCGCYEIMLHPITPRCLNCQHIPCKNCQVVHDTQLDDSTCDVHYTQS